MEEAARRKIFLVGCVGRQHEGAQDVGISIFLNGTIINGIQMRGNIPA
jgi:hypothetical protein